MTRPNILFICTDQQRWDSLGCYGNHHAKTPNIDRLASEGVVFEQCYVQSTVCAPSRASLMTGQYVHNHGLYANGVSMPGDPAIFSRSLADNGYTCGMIGKMHLASCIDGKTEARLDDGYSSYWWSHDPSHASPENDYHRWLKDEHPDLWKRVAPDGSAVRQFDSSFGNFPTEGHYSRWASERAIQFLDDQSEDDPFFLWVNFFDPHHPFAAPQEYLDMFPPDSVPKPIGFDGELSSKPPIQAEASRESYAGFAKGFTEYSAEELQNIVAAYCAMVTLIDDEVQRILDVLAANGQDQNTIVIFTSDHGEMLGDHQLLMKGPMLYDAAVRVPLIMKWPNQLPSGERRDELVQWIDLTATFLDLAGLDPFPSCQGTSLLPLARGEANAFRRGWAISEYRNSGHAYDPSLHATMLRTGDYKLVVQHGEPASDRPRTGELYDLSADPAELTNLWDMPDAQEQKLHLERMLLDVLVATEHNWQHRDGHW